MMHILKRLALSVPTLILITSIAFLLSKAMPGSSGAFLLEDDLYLGMQADGEIKEKVYRQYLHRTGQDKPLFYFKISSLAEPDTLFKVFPESHRAFLRRLCFTYGNWPFIADYYNSISLFEAKVKVSFTKEDTDITLCSLSTQLFDAFSESEVKNILDRIDLIIADSIDAMELSVSLEEVQDKFGLLLQHKTKINQLVPVLHWYGADNQYHAWLSGLLKGDIGHSLRNNRPVAAIIGETLGITLIMTLSAFVVGWIIAVFLGVLINLPSFHSGGKALMNGLYFLDTIPLFLLSFLLLILFSANDFQGALPSFGLGEYQHINNLFLRYFTLLRHLFLPVLCMTLVILPYFTGQVDRALKEEKNQEYVKTARAKGLTEHSILKKHVFKNALIPLITIFTDRLPILLSGALVVEVIFAIPGMGRLLVNSVNARDYPVILGIIVIIAVVKIVSNILADILYSLADPRIKLTA